MHYHKHSLHGMCGWQMAGHGFVSSLCMAQIVMYMHAMFHTQVMLKCHILCPRQHAIGTNHHNTSGIVENAAQFP